MKIKRIFLTIQTSASSGFADNIWKSIFYDTLIEMGIEVDLFSYKDALLKSKSKNLSTISESIYDEFITGHKIKPYDLFLSYYNSNHVKPELFKRLKEKVFCVNYTTNFHQIDSYLPLLKEANLSIYASKAAASYFDFHGIESYYMPFAGLEKYSSIQTSKTGRIAFIGTSYGNRSNYIWRCLQNDLPIDIYGANWLNNHKKRSTLRSIKLISEILTNNDLNIDTSYRCLNDCILNEISRKYNKFVHSPLPDNEYFELLSKSSIVLNFPESRFGHDYNNYQVLIGANLRDFEVPMSGSLLLTQDNDEIRSFFEEGKEMIVFSNEWEMIDKAKYYIKHTSENKKVALAGYKRVNSDHTWKHRFTYLLNYIETKLI